MANNRPTRIVLADDHQVVRHGIKQFLAAAGMEVVGEAEDGDEALRLIEQQQPDVAVLDVQMPHLSGIETARRVRAQGWPVGILILTAFDDAPYIMAALEAGVNGFVLKTADMEDIIAAVRAVHDGQSVLDPQVVAKLIHAVTASHQPQSSYESLTGRELEVLRAAACGLTNRAIGVLLSISDRTVQGHLRRIFEKLQVANRTEAVVKASQLGWLDLPPTSDDATG